MFKRIIVMLLSICFLGLKLLVAQNTAVPPQIQFHGVLAVEQQAGRIADGSLTTEGTEGNAGVRGVTFALYAEQSGGNALWMETQNVSVDAGGSYNALLGAETAGGIPQDIFASGEARWLEVSYTDAQGTTVAQPRVLLVSVPYAMKAGDAQTLGGLPASAFVLNPALLNERLSIGEGLPSAKVSGVVPRAANTANRVAKFANCECSMVDSLIYDDGALIGIGTTTPNAALHISLQDASIILGGAGTHSLAVQGTGSNGRAGSGQRRLLLLV